MAQDGSDLERRLTEIQSQINRLSLSLHLWRERQDRLAPMETRLSQLAEQCSELVDRWSVAGERQLLAVDSFERRLGALGASDLQAQQDATQELRDQAAALAEVALKVATSAVNGHEQTETRLSAIEGDLRHTLADLSGQLAAVVSELRTLTKPPQKAVAVQTPTWPLDGVVRLHNQLRDVDTGASPADEPAVAVPDRLRLPGAPGDLVERLETLERAMTEQHDNPAGIGRLRSLAIAAVALFVVGVLGAGVLVLRMQRQMEATTARMTESQRLAEAATQAANRQIAAAREDAVRQIAEARETALKAQTISDVLAAPDLVRYNLVGRVEAREASGASTAQALWSRSRGMVFSGSRLPPPPADSTYQIWLLTPADAVSVGTFVPDASGRFTMATTTPPKVPPPLSGISVTVERNGGSDRPTGATVLARAEVPIER